MKALGYVAVDSPEEVTDPGTLADLRIGLGFQRGERLAGRERWNDVVPSARPDTRPRVLLTRGSVGYLCA